MLLLCILMTFNVAYIKVANVKVSNNFSCFKLWQKSFSAVIQLTKLLLEISSHISDHCNLPSSKHTAVYILVLDNFPYDILYKKYFSAGIYITKLLLVYYIYISEFRISQLLTFPFLIICHSSNCK